MNLKRVTTIIVFAAIVFGALFASQVLATDMQMQHENMGQPDMDLACAVHCFVAATDDIQIATQVVTLIAVVVVGFLFLPIVSEPRLFCRLLPVEVAYKDPRLILSVQKKE